MISPVKLFSVNTVITSQNPFNLLFTCHRPSAGNRNSKMSTYYFCLCCGMLAFTSTWCALSYSTTGIFVLCTPGMAQRWEAGQQNAIQWVACKWGITRQGVGIYLWIKSWQEEPPKTTSILRASADNVVLPLACESTNQIPTGANFRHMIA